MSNVEEMTLEQKWEEAIALLDDKYIFFVTDILNMGRPKETTATKTADVGLTTDGEFMFRFNPNFAATLTVEQFGFLLAHECMHLVLRHIERMKNYAFDSGERKKANLAMDAIVNDLLAMNAFPVIQESAVRGADLIGEDCAFLPFNYVHSKIPDQDSDDEPESSTGDHDWIFDPQVDSDDDDSEDSPSEDEILEMFKDAMDAAMSSTVDQFMTQNGLDQSDNQIGKAPGQGTGTARSFAEVHGISIKWVELLRKVNPMMFKGSGPREMPTFKKIPRTLLSVYPDAIMPTYEIDDRVSNSNSELPGIVLAIDTSGSITPEMLNVFLTLGRSIPKDKVRVIPIGFHVSAYPIDLDNPRIVDGGTNFNCIEQYIRNRVMPNETKGHYPKAVVVITDLCASFTAPPKPEDRQNWTWLYAGNINGWVSTYHKGLVSLGFNDFHPLNSFMRKS